MMLAKIPKNKRQPLILTVIGTVAVLGLMGYFLIGAQLKNLDKLGQKQAETQLQLDQMHNAVKHADQIEKDLVEVKSRLNKAEADMASGDLYAWFVETFRNFKSNYKVEIPAFTPVAPATDVNLLPKFPYKQATMALSGSAYYHDLGQFIADLENRFPYMRVVNLSMEPAGVTSAADKEKLVFRMDVISLVKPNPS